jgi:hypothetical protein
VVFLCIITTNQKGYLTANSDVYKTLTEANAYIVNSTGINSVFDYYVVDPYNNIRTQNTYVTTNNGPVLISSSMSTAVVRTIPYDVIPRVVKENPSFAPGSDFDITSKLFLKPSLTIEEGDLVLSDFIDPSIRRSRTNPFVWVGSTRYS